MDIKEFVVMEAENRKLMVDPCKECKPGTRGRDCCQEKDPCVEVAKAQEQATAREIIECGEEICTEHGWYRPVECRMCFDCWQSLKEKYGL